MVRNDHAQRSVGLDEIDALHREFLRLDASGSGENDHKQSGTDDTCVDNQQSMEDR
jgi:hypothetical protein